ncbi:hypothetical protein ACF0H5_000664 [Mactra antiquata]
MAGDMSDTGTYYSKGVGLIYVFNLIVGTGALTMPKAFQQAGWVLGLTTIIILSFMSFLTVTFVTEAMSVSNALLKKYNRMNHSINEEQDEINEERPLLLDGRINVQEYQTSPYDISLKTELGHMASLFFNRIGRIMFNLCIVIYLYGDLAIYAAAVPKSVRDIACTYKIPHNASNCNNTELTDDEPCWSGSTISRMSMYRICVGGFFLLLGGFTFFNVQKTKYLQLITTASRWIAFGMMITLALIRLSKDKGQGHPPLADISGMPNLFGVCVYSFMCHHSLPSLITPIKNKSRLYTVLGCDYILILLFYLLISFTGIYAFSEVNDIYTLNFLPDPCNDNNNITQVQFIQYFLALFPVFTLSTNFPIISITLRNNLKTIGYDESKPYTWFVDRIFFPVITLIPPLSVALATNQVEFLVGITGSYAGAGIQYIIPAMLVYCARKQSYLFEEPNRHLSPFKGTFWVIFAVGWAIVCMGFVTVNHIISGE